MSRLYLDRGEEPIPKLTDERKTWNGKQIGNLLLIMIIADSEYFMAKSKLIKYTGEFVERYKWRNYRQVHKIHGIVELDKWHT